MNESNLKTKVLKLYSLIREQENWYDSQKCPGAYCYRESMHAAYIGLEPAMNGKRRKRGNTRVKMRGLGSEQCGVEPARGKT